MYLVMGANAETGEQFLWSTADTEETAERVAKECSEQPNVSSAVIEGGHHQPGCWDTTVYVKGIRHPYTGTPVCKK